ncbi:hypothetical protein Novomoskovsk_47 [Bacillus phage Novomoskovsk]|uniref:Uncharacterized protein n=1 Tax=Bacillus phage Novomoskovsk TaxID=2736258 RepID=A0A6M9Z7D0_9CAUD|nr:hypothetical protein Novomoskovsk_47 [Bacillus phage Novomoskovsk]
MIMPQAEAAKIRKSQYLTDEQLEEGVNDAIKYALDKMVSRVEFEIYADDATDKQWKELKRKVKKAGYQVLFCGKDYTQTKTMRAIEFLID